MPRRLPSHRPLAHLDRLQDKARGTSAERGYGARWRRYRLLFLARHPLCVECGAPATDVDHVRAVAGPSDPLFWQEANHQALCHACHSRKTRREDGGLGVRPQGEGGQ